MRQFLVGLSISVAFIVGCVTAQHLPGAAVPTASAYAGQRWEYKCQDWPVLPANGQDSAQRVTEMFNQLGAEGFELVTPTPLGGMACFKRVQ
jgi:hypothetical protein